ncbi:MAG: hypothetical protein VX913_14445, partial [Planctomycetota bacterium]|nr:hypothetical protein [Planctomycetota bacterium]
SKINDQIDQRKRAARSSGMESIFVGLVLGGIGAAITAATYSAAEPGGSYVVTSGLFFVGGWYVLRGLVRMMTTNP